MSGDTEKQTNSTENQSSKNSTPNKNQSSENSSPKNSPKTPLNKVEAETSSEGSVWRQDNAD